MPNMTPTIAKGGMTERTTTASLGERYTISPLPMSVCAMLRHPSLRLSVSALPTSAVSGSEYKAVLAARIVVHWYLMTVG